MALSFTMASHETPPPFVADRLPAPTGRTPEDLAAWVALSSVPGLGSATLWSLIRAFGALSLAWSASAARLRAAGVSPAVVKGIESARQQKSADDALEKLTKHDGRAVAWHDPAYPSQLREIPDPPPLIYVKGNLDCADYQRTVAIVGTRRMTAYGKQVTAQLAGVLARAGLCIVSGMAAGIDGEAHRAALDADGTTVACWGTGLHEVYPRSNRRLVPRILERGAIVTEYPIGMRGLPENFPQRNRIISGLSLATIVVEAPLESGALHTARYAIEQNREILAVPGSVFAAASRGTNRLINRGEARAVTSATDVLEALQIAVSPEQLEMPQLVKPTSEERALLRHLTTDPIHIDELVRLAALPAFRVSALLAVMEVKGIVRNLGSAHYVNAHPSGD